MPTAPFYGPVNHRPRRRRAVAYGRNSRGDLLELHPTKGWRKAR